MSKFDLHWMLRNVYPYNAEDKKLIASADRYYKKGDMKKGDAAVRKTTWFKKRKISKVFARVNSVKRFGCRGYNFYWSVYDFFKRLSKKGYISYQKCKEIAIALSDKHEEHHYFGYADNIQFFFGGKEFTHQRVYSQWSGILSYRDESGKYHDIKVLAFFPRPCIRCGKMGCDWQKYIPAYTENGVVSGPYYTDEYPWHPDDHSIYEHQTGVFYPYYCDACQQELGAELKKYEAALQEGKKLRSSIYALQKEIKQCLIK